jgi:hypothetical protein
MSDRETTHTEVTFPCSDQRDKIVDKAINEWTTALQVAACVRVLNASSDVQTSDRIFQSSVSNTSLYIVLNLVSCSLQCFVYLILVTQLHGYLTFPRLNFILQRLLGVNVGSALWLPHQVLPSVHTVWKLSVFFAHCVAIFFSLYNYVLVDRDNVEGRIHFSTCVLTIRELTVCLAQVNSYLTISLFDAAFWRCMFCSALLILSATEPFWCHLWPDDLSLSVDEEHGSNGVNVSAGEKWRHHALRRVASMLLRTLWDNIG